MNRHLPQRYPSKSRSLPKGYLPLLNSESFLYPHLPSTYLDEFFNDRRIRDYLSSPRYLENKVKFKIKGSNIDGGYVNIFGVSVGIFYSLRLKFT